MRNADTGAGVPRGATVRTECNWAKSSHAGAQPASFVVIVCLSLSLSLSLSLCRFWLPLVLPAFCLLHKSFASLPAVRWRRLARAPGAGTAPVHLGKRKCPTAFYSSSFPTSWCDSGGGDGPQRPWFDSRRPGAVGCKAGRGRPAKNVRPAGQLPFGFCVDVVRLLPLRI